MLNSFICKRAPVSPFSSHILKLNKECNHRTQIILKQIQQVCHRTARESQEHMAIETNYILIIINITVLSLFQYPPPSWTFPIFLLFTELNWLKDLKIKMQIIPLFSFIASLCVIPEVSDFFASCALGLAMNVGYEINQTSAPLLINCCLGIGIIVGDLTNFVEKYGIGRDIVLLVCTLPNIFMAQNSAKKRPNGTLWLLNPYYDRKWAYSSGFIMGGFLPFISISKHFKFFIISLILLLSIFLDEPIYIMILSFVRGLFIYDESKHQSELYFLIGYILVDLFAADYTQNYLFIGYLVIGVILLFESQQMRVDQPVRSLERPLIKEIPLLPISR